MTLTPMTAHRRTHVASSASGPPGEEVSKLTYYGLYALQHRGQESAGIAVSEGSRILVYKDMGLVAQVFDESVLGTLRGHLAIGHCRYSTTGSSVWENAQPTLSSTDVGGLALAHNGNLINTPELAQRLAPGRHQGDHRHRGADHAAGPGPQPAPSRTRPPSCCRRSRAPTRWCSWTRRRSTPPATRRASARWSWAGWSAAGWSPPRPRRSTSWAPRSSARSSPASCSRSTSAACARAGSRCAEPKGCLFEYVYLARPDTTIAGRGVQATRVEVGRVLAREHPVEADLVIPTPESGTPAAIGYAEESGIPYGQGLVKNSYVGRTFIQPSQTIRQLGIRLKLNPLREVVEGKRLVVVDDSIVRGNTQRAIVKMLREAGAREVHVRISSPPVSPGRASTASTSPPGPS